MRRFFLTMMVLVVIGCGSSTPAGSEATCAANCGRMELCASARQTATNPPPGACETECHSSRASHPQCLAQINAVSACVAAKVTFFCQADGGPVAVPGGACSDEVQACLQCTGELVACSG